MLICRYDKKRTESSEGFVRGLVVVGWLVGLLYIWGVKD